MKTCTLDNCSRPHRARGLCSGHWKRWRQTGDPQAHVPLAQRVRRIYDSWQDLVDVDGIGCWTWTGVITPGGYGQFGRCSPAHRYVYEQLVGPIPDGMHLDHLCRNTQCVNPDHLEPVTQEENNRRGYSPWAKRSKQTHCKRGHPLSGGNVSRNNSNGTRRCLTCHRQRERARHQRRREDVA